MNPVLNEKKDNTVPIRWVYSKSIRLNFRDSIIIIQYISILKEQKQYGYFNRRSSLDEIQNTYLWLLKLSWLERKGLTWFWWKESVGQNPTANIIINDESLNIHDSRKETEKSQKLWGLWKEKPEYSHCSHVISSQATLPTTLRPFYIHNNTP